MAKPSLAVRPALSGVLLVDKPRGLTSHAVVSSVRRRFGQREVGHTGTLDPMATGLMVLALGRATRIARFIEAEDKAYEGTVTLGRATTTFDAEGETTVERPVEGFDDARIERALETLRGSIEQAVPPFSAVKVGGERLYSRARRGETFDTPIRTVKILDLRATSIAVPDIVIEAHVSKGTYIRSLAVQIGDALGTPAHLGSLRRTRVGVHRVEDAKPLDAIEGRSDELLTMEAALAHLPSLRLDGTCAEHVRHGRALQAGMVTALAGTRSFQAGDPLVLLSPEGSLLAVGFAAQDAQDLAAGDPHLRAVRYACVLAPAATRSA